MPHIRNGNKDGLSLVEILVAMTAFAVIFTGLASTFQALMIANRVTIDLSDCLHHYKDGMRLLLEGDPANPDTPHAGLYEATNVKTASGTLQYQANGFSYTVWAEDGQLLRECEPATAAEPRVLMGESLESPPRKRIMVSSFTYDFAADEAASATKSLVRLSIFLHGETDDNKEADVNEARLIMHPTVFLRNAELEL